VRLPLLAALLAAALVGALAQPPRAAAPDSDGVVAGLQRWLDGTSSLTARFKQSLVSGALGTQASESGVLYLERPGKLRWDYREPDPKIALLLGDRTFLYLEADQQYLRGTIGTEQALFPRLLAGRGRVTDLFSADLLATPKAGGHGSYRLRLTPKGGSGALAEVILTLTAGDFGIEAAEAVDESGNRTTYALSGVVRNGGVPEGIFGFEPPPGTEVVDQP
jgi:outer membrane lipoprotein carrier protein